ncbi:hypothetical protein E2C01_101270 [Portunus trituberculatus]|uniref:Uncharacterized protein n=1 Tax=Portunus trituberculatus TaxID=210409 RepID=A0A5B7KA89_PORTR|nr:hypothetical protein [Portunus trituberculatus]
MTRRKKTRYRGKRKENEGDGGYHGGRRLRARQAARGGGGGGKEEEVSSRQRGGGGGGVPEPAKPVSVLARLPQLPVTRATLPLCPPLSLSHSLPPPLPPAAMGIDAMVSLDASVSPSCLFFPPWLCLILFYYPLYVCCAFPHVLQPLSLSLSLSLSLCSTVYYNLQLYFSSSLNRIILLSDLFRACSLLTSLNHYRELLSLSLTRILFTMSP